MTKNALHRDYVRERHSDLLRQAREGELAYRLAEARQEERRTVLARLARRRVPSATPARSF